MQNATMMGQRRVGCYFGLSGLSIAKMLEKNEFDPKGTTKETIQKIDLAQMK